MDPSEHQSIKDVHESDVVAFRSKIFVVENAQPGKCRNGYENLGKEEEVTMHVAYFDSFPFLDVTSAKLGRV